MAIKTPQGAVVDLPRGTRDYNPKESIAIKEMLSVIEEIFKRHGFAPIMTPAMESTQVLNAKAYGDESTKQMYVIDGTDAALRFDLTVPLARYMAMNKDLPMPFKRYQIDKVWRRDEPQRMRSREFMQADIDIVGSPFVTADAECVEAMLNVLEALGLKNCSMLINSRQILNMILEHFNVAKDKQSAAIRIFDKMSKVSIEETIKQLKSLGVGDNDAQSMIAFITEKMLNTDKLNKLETTMPESKEEVEKMRELLGLLTEYGAPYEIKVDLSLARGLDYYTGMIWEAVVETAEGSLPSIASGGRYDNLIGMYSKSPAPAVGSSIGITRIFDVLNREDGSSTYAKVFIAQIGKENSKYAISVAKKMRKAGIYADMNVTEKGISKQLEYSNALGIKYVVIIGTKEREQKQVKIKNMQAGTEELLDLDSAIATLKMI